MGLGFIVAVISQVVGSWERVAVPSQVSVGVLAVTVPRFKVDDAVAACRVREKRSDGQLPAHVTAYLMMELCLFADDPCEEVATKVTGSLSEWGCWSASWPVPTASAISQARKRLGRDVVRDLFYRAAEPVAERDTRGAYLRVWRLTAIDGFELDLPDTKENAAEFGRAGSEKSGSRSAFAKARVVAVAECGTHAFVDAEVGAIHAGERTLAGAPLDRLGQDWLLTADRGFYSIDAWGRSRGSGAELLCRAPTQLRLPLVAWLPDGTYLSVLIKPGLRDTARTGLIEDAKAGRALDPGRAHLVRVVEYTVPDCEGTELICLITSITDPAKARRTNSPRATTKGGTRKQATISSRPPCAGPARSCARSCRTSFTKRSGPTCSPTTHQASSAPSSPPSWR